MLPAATLAVAFVVLKYHSTLLCSTPRPCLLQLVARTHKLTKTCPNELITLASARVDDVAPLLLDNNSSNNNYPG